VDCRHVSITVHTRIELVHELVVRYTVYTSGDRAALENVQSIVGINGELQITGARAKV
jgi:hypothetical protein